MFCNKYGISEEVIDYYIDSVKINDILSMDSYKLIMENECPHDLIKDMRIELKDLVKKRL